ncbi:hypothetical protein B7990_00425 [Fibrobacter sp. UWB4]|uniref:4Fe-4S single cluster domain-containing protein n=1 Tax=Fibrobacter sp. UWB4 TaxID=1964356 RepID=UPI000B5289E5|nr:4Fe-4S single cluster domain-containing protein [Fibrobacter sp. UWB4]OWV19677.1 hypothetical protein B7990_00425 [Fibrobacter sp. UWB4]
MINVNHIEAGSYVNGTGKRFVLWVQGCGFHCKGCGNPDTWSFDENKYYSVQELLSMIIKDSSLDGVTFSGGEPFLQAEELSKLAAAIKEHTKLTIHIFTGFELEEIKQPKQIKLLNLVDTLVYGRFDKTKPNNNQKVWHNPQGNDSWKFNNTDVEIDIDNDGDININGFPTEELINDIKDIQNERI